MSVVTGMVIAAWFDGLTNGDWFAAEVTIISGLIALTPGIISYFVQRGKQTLLWRVSSATPILQQHTRKKLKVSIRDNQGQKSHDPSHPVRPEEEVDNLHMLVLKMRNAGNKTIDENDFKAPIGFQFKDHEVLAIADVNTHPNNNVITVDEVRTLSSNEDGQQKIDTIEFPRRAFSQRDSIDISVLLRGKTIDINPVLQDSSHDIVPLGGLKTGTFDKDYQKNPFPFLRFFLALSIFVMLVAFVLSLTYNRFLPTPTISGCVPSKIAVGGSTAIRPFAADVARLYASKCAGASITINENVTSSTDGLAALGFNKLDIATSDVKSSNLFFADRTVLAIPFVIVVSDDVYTSIKDLSTEQISKIYTGKTRNWKELDGPDQEITVVNRNEGSGTFATFKQFVLEKDADKIPTGNNRFIRLGTTELVADQVQQNKGVIGYVDVGNALQKKLKYVTINGQSADLDNINKNTYKFWSIEHMYTRGNPTGLTKAFLDFLMSDDPQVLELRNKYRYLEFNRVHADLINSHMSKLTAPS